MYGEKIFRSKVLTLGLIGAFVVLLCPAEAWTQTARGRGSIKGNIFNEDLRTPFENVVVKIRNTEDGLEMESPPTDDTGAYKISDVRVGRYVLGVATADGNFNFDYMVDVKANETARLSLAVKPSKGMLSEQGDADKQKKKKGVFATTAGILILVTGSALLTLGIINIASPMHTSSPSKKKKKW